MTPAITMSRKEYDHMVSRINEMAECKTDEERAALYHRWWREDEAKAFCETGIAAEPYEPRR